MTKSSLDGHTKSTIDPAITNNITITNIYIHMKLVSDHRSVTYVINPLVPEHATYRVPKFFEKVNWIGYHNYLKHIQITLNKYSPNKDPQIFLKKLKTTFNTAITFDSNTKDMQTK